MTADGRLRHASAERDADLFWAARGAGAGFFGVVTRFHLQAYPLPAAIVTSTYVFALEQLRMVVEWVSTTSAGLSPAVEVALTLTRAPGDAIAHGAGSRVVCTVIATAFADTHAAAVAMLAPLENSALVRDAMWRESQRPTTFDSLYDDMDRLFPPRHRYVADTLWSNADPAEVVGALRDHVGAAPSAKSLVLCVIPPPPLRDAPPMPDAAFSMVGRSIVLCYAIWDDPRDDAANRAWHEQAMRLLEPFASGHYAGESDFIATPSRARGSFMPGNWERLRAVRKAYDPQGLFHGFFDTE